jgi:IPT/TIG domain
VNPSAGRESGGTTVTISGTNLSGATAVRFGSTDAASFSVSSDTSIAAVSPPGTGTADVTVTTPGGTSSNSSGDRFSYAGLPTVTGVAPVTGPVDGGTAVTISGTNLTGATAVEFGPTGAASYTVKSAASIIAVSPAELAGVVQVSVTTPGGTSSTSSNTRFKFAPTITGLSPNAGSTAGGTSVTVTGTGFALGTRATMFRFGSARAASVDCSSTTNCTVTTRAHEAGRVNLKAIVSGIESPKSLADEFTYG